jgi:L-iditol 2-dehydrogenase
MPAPHRAVELREIPEPELEPDSALLAIELSEVCGTDLHLQQGRLAEVPYPLVPGHVSVGRLERIRGGLCDVDGRPFAEGDRVTFLDVHRTCNRCWHCLVAKASTRCPQRKVYGITYGLADGLTGGWAEKLYLKPGTMCIRLDGVESELYMAGGCSLPTALHAVERGALRFGDTVLVLGAGPVGLSVVAFASLRGAGRILCIGGPAHRLETARTLGAGEVLDFTTCSEDARRDWVLEHTSGRGADVCIEATGNPQAVTQALRWTRDAGCVVVVGQYTDAGEAALNPHLDVNKKHLDVRGCWGSDFSHFYRGVEMLKTPAGQRLWSAVKLDRYPLSRVNDALADVAAGKCVKALVVPRP